MSVLFKRRSMDVAIDADVNSDFCFDKFGQISSMRSGAIFWRKSEANDEAQKMYHDACEAVSGKAVGFVEFENVYVMGPSGIIFDVNKSVVWHGDSLNWPNMAFRRLDFGKSGIAIDAEKNEITVHQKRLDEAVKIPKAIMWGAPGFQIYGHWLIDFLPRLIRISNWLNQQTDPSDYVVLSSILHSWGHSIYESLGLGLKNAVREMPPFRLLHCEKLVVPTFLRRKRVFDNETSHALWSSLKGLAFKEGTPSSGPQHKRIFVDRSQDLNDVRRIENHNEVRSYLSKRGFLAIRPEHHSFLDQIRMFAAADQVFGIDGSAMHNTIFSPAGSRIGVIIAKKNLFHCSLAAALDQQVDYFRTDVTSWGRRQVTRGPLEIVQTVNLVDLEAAVDAMLDQ